ncbi:DUF3515 domain-containing protein [Mycobacterium xenopi]|uniref:Membrane protein n=1 Tax=Mycobacterium xenopi TaxID=1789 RepID=A0AAD1M2N2_MYCXE|nr:DUF3515 domain-containing protein [Mycobacterium xenopi]MDA3639254.1 DUF3515 domain-containing protein [Mycobacterium xenopi]MDA3657626.1 DUF3515 domain-containing protein [Mycobacterium xenopi]MDA3661650.1 DUF3515 domain-containing protein [Mycobacterium xenopi]ORX19880.1 hypothetical protein AWC32_08640 [Mycobacterium xenopi]SPX89222.1 conserved secreted protein [Mycobacterium xenopi]
MDAQSKSEQLAGSDGPPRALLIAALLLTVVVIGIMLAIAATRHPPQQPVAIPAVPAPQADDPACRALLQALPQRLGDYQRAPAARPVPPGAAAWRARGTAEPVVLRCGLTRPPDFVVGSPIQVVDRVQWFQEMDTQAGGQAGRSTWYTVDRPVYVALTLPPGSGSTPIQEISEVIDRSIAAVPIAPAPPTG